ncbi:Plasmodium exported protein, unknown function [Plasmodium malariae]|nr:Plasmodium exported protein, unknown function [Plasmodium malariae]
MPFQCSFEEFRGNNKVNLEKIVRLSNKRLLRTSNDDQMMYSTNNHPESSTQGIRENNMNTSNEHGNNTWRMAYEDGLRYTNERRFGYIGNCSSNLVHNGSYLDNMVQPNSLTNLKILLNNNIRDNFTYYLVSFFIGLILTKIADSEVLVLISAAIGGVYLQKKYLNKENVDSAFI